MSLEIERKFLVKNDDFKKEAHQKKRIQQGYLNTDKSRAEKLLALCKRPIIDKTRFFVKAGHQIFEIDEFYGENQDLIVAEIELNSENESFQKPLWLGKEVTGNKKYYNSSLIQNPFKNW